MFSKFACNFQSCIQIKTFKISHHTIIISSYIAIHSYNLKGMYIPLLLDPSLLLLSSGISRCDTSSPKYVRIYLLVSKITMHSEASEFSYVVENWLG